jgi:CheY-like chemotaxis protein
MPCSQVALLLLVLLLLLLLLPLLLLQTCRRIRAAMAGSGLHLPIVMLTAQVGTPHAAATAAKAKLLAGLKGACCLLRLVNTTLDAASSVCFLYLLLLLSTVCVTVILAALPPLLLLLQVAAQSVEQSLSAGADDHLSKPCTREELMAVITRNYKKQQRI